MSSDRDRLAADLASIRFGAAIEHPSQYEYDWADRLIALGWTLAADANTRLSAAHQSGIEVGRNEERARIRAAVEQRWPNQYAEVRAVLAIIDREDADDRP